MDVTGCMSALTSVMYFCILCTLCSGQMDLLYNRCTSLFTCFAYFTMQDLYSSFLNVCFYKIVSQFYSTLQVNFLLGPMV